MTNKFDLGEEEIQSFIEHGYVKIENAFPSELAEEARRILWADTKCDPGDPATWTRPVIRLFDYSQEPFRKAANTEKLHAAFDQLVGHDKWLPRNSLGSFPIRFPSAEDPGDTGWHVDASFPGENAIDFQHWRINVYSKGRGLLMLFLFSDVSEKDAPTKLRKGSHSIVAKILMPYGEEGLSFFELAGQLKLTENCEEALATGNAGTVYLCHPFVAHAAQKHYGTSPKFMAQPPLPLKKEFELNDEGGHSPVELAILQAIRK